MIKRIFAGFLLLLTAGVLFAFPFSTALYDFKTDLKTDNHGLNTGVGVTTGSVILAKPPYLDDTSTLTISSNLAGDAATFVSYNATSRELALSGLSDNSTRTITLNYDTYALSGFSAIDTVVSRFDLIWIIGVIAFVVAGVVVLFIGEE